MSDLPLITSPLQTRQDVTLHFSFLPILLCLMAASLYVWLSPPIFAGPYCLCIRNRSHSSPAKHISVWPLTGHTDLKPAVLFNMHIPVFVQLPTPCLPPSVNNWWMLEAELQVIGLCPGQSCQKDNWWKASCSSALQTSGADWSSLHPGVDFWNHRKCKWRADVHHHCQHWAAFWRGVAAAESEGRLLGQSGLEVTAISSQKSDNSLLLISLEMKH